MRRSFLLLVLLAAALAAGCGADGARQDDGHAGAGEGRHGSGGGPRRGEGGDDPTAAAVPVEVAPVVRRSISSFIETNGTIEAENEVDLVARVAAPIVELLAEEGMRVHRGQTLLRLEQTELAAQLEISRVALNEATLVYERARKLHADHLISEEEYEQAKADFEAATAQLDANQIQLGYTEVTAPFDGLIVARYVDLAQHVTVNTPLFRISDFDPLLCPIQVPERDLKKLHVGQAAHLELEPWPDTKFPAKVLRVSPVVNSGTGTIKVTLEITPDARLRPGMFARVFLQTERRDGVLVIPTVALSLESIGDTVYVADHGTASRREVRLGFREGDYVEVAEGLAEGESVVVVGHDGLSDGTPVQVLEHGALEGVASSETSAPPARRGPPDFSTMSPEQLERAKQFMRARGMSEKEIAERLREGGPRPDQGPPPAGRRDAPGTQ